MVTMRWGYCAKCKDNIMKEIFSIDYFFDERTGKFSQDIYLECGDVVKIVAGQPQFVRRTPVEKEFGL